MFTGNRHPCRRGKSRHPAFRSGSEYCKDPVIMLLCSPRLSIQRKTAWFCPSATDIPDASARPSCRRRRHPSGLCHTDNRVVYWWQLIRMHRIFYLMRRIRQCGNTIGPVSSVISNNMPSPARLVTRAQRTPHFAPHSCGTIYRATLSFTLLL